MQTTSFGDTLRHYRKTSMYSIAQVANILRENYDIVLSPKTIYGWENNQSLPSIHNFLSLCHIYKISNILEVFGYEEFTPKTPLVLNSEEREIILKYRSHNFPNSALRKLYDIED